jgi:hypothetical protein
MPCPSEIVPGTWRMMSPTTGMMGACTPSIRVADLIVFAMGLTIIL